MQFNPYGGPAAELAAALVNADAATDLGAVLTEHGLTVDADGLTPDQVRRLRAWADRLRPAFTSGGSASHGGSASDGSVDGSPAARVDGLDGLVEVVNALLADSACRPYVSRHDGRVPHLHYADERADLAERVAAFTAAGVAAVLCGDHRRLGHCDRPGCAVVYVDTSRNGRRRFCSLRCANQWHVARHRDRAGSAVSAHLE